MCATLEHGTVALTNNNSYVVYKKIKSKKFDYLMTVLFSTDPKIGAGKQFKTNHVGDINVKGEWDSNHPFSSVHGVKTLYAAELESTLARVGR